MVERTLTQRELNRALLARQHLLERSQRSIPHVLEQMAGLQAQYAPSMYIGLWSRMQRFERDDLDRALERRTVVQGTLMRSTIHLVSARDYWPFALAIRESRRRWWLRTHSPTADPREVRAAARRLRRSLAGRTLQRSEIAKLLGRGAILTNGVGLWLELVRVPPSGTWGRRRADLYAAAEDWLGPPQMSVEQGHERLVRRYLGGFGPSTAGEIANWAGVRPEILEPVLARLRLGRFRSEDGAELLDLPRAPLPDPQTPASVRFLPVWEATMLVHARRSGILPEEYRPVLFSSKNPASANTFLVDGAVAGTWKYERGSLRVEPFGRLARSVRAEVDEEAERLVELYR
jgi:hypothetical protein